MNSHDAEIKLIDKIMRWHRRQTEVQEPTICDKRASERRSNGGSEKALRGSGKTEG